jgi:hypothetical protein
MSDLLPIRTSYACEVKAYSKSASGNVEIFPGTTGVVLDVPKEAEADGEALRLSNWSHDA